MYRVEWVERLVVGIPPTRLYAGRPFFGSYAMRHGTPEDIARIVGYVTAAFGFGLLFVTGLALLMADEKLAALVGLPEVALRMTAIAILAFVGAVFVAATVGPQQVTVFARKHQLRSRGDRDGLQRHARFHAE